MRANPLWPYGTRASGEKLGRIPAAKEKVQDVMFGSSRRDSVAIASDTNRLTIWDIRDPVQPHELQTMSTEGKIRFINFAPAENRIAAALLDNKVVLFEAKTGVQQSVISSQAALNMAFNPAGTLLAIALRSGSIKVWDCDQGKEREEIPLAAGLANQLMVTSADQVVTSGQDGIIRVWNLTGELVKTLEGADWRPQSPEDAARLSGLVVHDLDVQFLTPSEEEKLKIDASVPLEEEGLADYWCALDATKRQFAKLQDQPEVRPEEVEKNDQLGKWVESQKQSPSDFGHKARIDNANDLRDELRANLATKYLKLGNQALVSGNPERAVQICDSIIKFTLRQKVAETLALRGFARHVAGDQQGALKDRESCLNATPVPNILALDSVLHSSLLSSEQLRLTGEYLSWLQPDYANGQRYQAQAGIN